MKTIIFIGLGLIGGSMAKCVRKNKLFDKIIAYDQNEEWVKLALFDKTIDEGYVVINDRINEADVVVIATPVDTIITYIEKILPYLKKSCTITDVGSTKSHVISYVNNRSEEFHFVAGHPMAGTEKVGYTGSNENMFLGAKYLLMGTKKTQDADFEKINDLVLGLGAIPTVLPLEYHDKLVAAISHTPHVVAASLVNLVAQEETGDFMRDLVAGGFKDTTRIASSGANMWSSICIDNKDEILKSISNFKNIINGIEKSIEEEDYEALMEFFTKAKIYRDSIIEG